MWSSCSWQRALTPPLAVPQTQMRRVWLPPTFYASNVPTSMPQMLSFMTRGQEGAGITFRVWQQSTLPFCKPRYKCTMIFNDPSCTLTWKSKKCFETPSRFNLLSAPESNGSLGLILDMRSNYIQIPSPALINFVVSIVHSCCVSKFFKNMFTPRQW